jgi:hypothetical protein
MKQFAILAAILSLLPLLNSCKKVSGSGDIVTETRAVTGFHGVSLSMEADVAFLDDSVYEVKISAQQNIIDVIETPVEGTDVVIKLKDNTVLGKHDPIHVFISGPNISRFTISGSGSISLNNILTGNSISTNISGSGNITGSGIVANDLSTVISGSGNCEFLSGTLNFEHLNISGSGNIKVSAVSSDTCFATISGSGNILVNVAKYLDGTISGSGNIRYYGNPIINSHISGSGNIGPL